MQDYLIGMIYDAPLAERPFESVMPMLRGATNSTGLVFKFSQPGASDTGAIIADASWDFRDSRSQYLADYRYKDPVDYAGMAAGRFYRFEDLIDRDRLTRSEFYRHFCRPLNIDHAFFVYLGRHDGLDVWLNGSREAARGAYSGEEEGLVTALFPHLERAIATHVRLERQRCRSAIYAETVSALGVGVVLLDRNGHVLDTNREADAILSGGSPVRLCDGRLRLVGTARRAYAECLDRAAGDPSAPAQAFAATDPAGRRVGLLIRRTDALLPQAGIVPPAFVVYLDGSDDEGLTARAEATVVRLFDLTPAEARLAVRLAQGLTLDQAASCLGVTLTTARTYCKRAMAKAGASRQADLVRLVLTSLARLG